MSSRKDDPVFNVKFVQLVECHPCLWNSTLPAYSKKEEIQKAWQEVANETKDTVRNSRERWRTIRSSFLRSLKLSRTTTGRGKRKYYLSKYLQFLIPYTKTRLKSGANIILRKASCLPPMTRINHMPMPLVSEETKDSINSELAIAEDDVLVSLHEDAAIQQQQQHQQQQQQHHQLQQQQHHRAFVATTIKTELDAASPLEQRRCIGNTINGFLTTTASASASTTTTTTEQLHQQQQQQQQQHSSSTLAQTTRSASAVDLTEFAEWIKSKNDHHRHCLMPSSPDADQSFLNSLHPFLKEMSGKQNRRFRQKVVALVDAILDNAD